MSTQITSKEPCPLCLLQNKANNPLINRPGQFGTRCSKVSTHEFNDTEELRNLQAQARMAYPMLYSNKHQGPGDDPERFANSDIVLDPENKAAMEQFAGVKFTGPGDLKGVFIATVQSNREMEAELKSLRATVGQLKNRAAGGKSGATPAGLLPNQFIVEVPEWGMSGLTEQAEWAGKTAQEWVTDEVNGYFETYFGSTAR